MKEIYSKAFRLPHSFMGINYFTVTRNPPRYGISELIWGMRYLRFLKFLGLDWIGWVRRLRLCSACSPQPQTNKDTRYQLVCVPTNTPSLKPLTMSTIANFPTRRELLDEWKKTKQKNESVILAAKQDLAELDRIISRCRTRAARSKEDAKKAKKTLKRLGLQKPAVGHTHISIESSWICYIYILVGRSLCYEQHTGLPWLKLNAAMQNR